MEQMKLETKNITDENIKKILKLFPNVATEALSEDGKLKTAIDFEKLKQELSEVAIDGEECYDFTWVGKKEAMVEANRPIRKTLRPDRDSSVDWENTENIYIEGDNLDALKLLQESYLGKIKMIYIDPPYNTGKDFVYRDNFHKNSDDNDSDINYKNDENEINFSKSNELFQNTESNGRFHSDWCSMIYSRLKLARNLLSEDGVIFISIDDNEVRNLKNICDEIFGEDNFVSTLIWNKQHSQQQGIFKRYHESVLIYAKNIFNIKNIEGGEGIIDAGALKKISSANPESEFLFPIGVRFEAQDGTMYMGTYGDSEKVTVKKGTLVAENGRTKYPVVLSAGWTQKNQMKDYFDGKDVYDTKGQKVIEFYFNSTGKLKCRKERSRITPPSILPEYGMVSEATDELTKLMGVKVFDTPKPINMLKDFLNWFCKNNDIILDFFSGSATTAHAVMQLNAEDGGNRKFIMVQIPQTCDEKSEAYKTGYKNICEIGEERIRRAGKKIQEENPDKKIDVGFRVFKVDTTNMKDVYYTPSELKQGQLNYLETNIKDDRTDEDLLYGCLLDWGVELSLPHRVEIIDGKRVHIVDEDTLVACFEENIPESVIRKIASMKPLRVVFRDSSFSNDDNKINVEEIFKLITPDTRVKVI